MPEHDCDRPIPTIPPEAVRALHDGSKRVAYALALETADRLREDPSLVLRALAWRRRFPLAVEDDQATWLALLEGPVDVLCRELLRLDGRGELLRDTKPSFGPVEAGRLEAISAAACNAHA